MEKLDIALNKHLTGEESRTLIQELDNPEKLLTPGLLPRDSILIEETEIILDSLTAYNNGVDNSFREVELEEISPESPLYSWKNLTLAIKMFYLGNRKEMIHYLNEIDPVSPTYSLSKQLLNPLESSLYIPNKELESDIDTLQDALEARDHELYEKSLKLVKESISGFKKKEVENIILTIIEDSIEIIPINIIERSISGIVDTYTKFRLLAIGTLFTNPIVSIKYWVNSITDSGIAFDRETFDSSLGIIRDIVSTLIKDKYKITPEDKEILEPFLKILYLELNRLYPRDIKLSKSILTTLKRYLDIKDKKIRNKQSSKLPVQMELF